MKLSFKRKGKPYSFEVENELGALCSIDASETIGGRNTGMRPMELLASSLAGCLAIGLLSILKKQRKESELFEIDIEATRQDGLPSPFEEITFHIRIDDDLNNDQLSAWIEKILEKYCSVSASLEQSIQVKYTINQKS